MKTETETLQVGEGVGDITSATMLPKIQYAFVPDVENPITTAELAEVISSVFSGLGVSVTDEFLDKLNVPTRRHFASKQQHTSPPVTDHEPKPESV